MFPNSSPWLWYAVSALAVLAAVSVWNWPIRLPGLAVLATTPPRDPSIAPPEVTPCGGESVTLEVRASFDDDYYGYGWLSGEGVKRTGQFNLYWRQTLDKAYIQKGEVARIKITDFGGYTFSIWGDVGNDIHTGLPWRWLKLRVEIHSRKSKGEFWTHRYKFRGVGKSGFEIEEDQDEQA